VPAELGLRGQPPAECAGGPEGPWQTLGYCRNPRLDIDSISDNGVPENINVDVPGNGETFRVMTHYYSGTGVVRPMVNIYCGGVLRGSYGAPGNQLTNFDTSGSSTGDIWRVVDATMQVVGGVTTGCTLTPLHPPSQSTGRQYPHRLLGREPTEVETWASARIDVSARRRGGGPCPLGSGLDERGGKPGGRSDAEPCDEPDASGRATARAQRRVAAGAARGAAAAPESLGQPCLRPDGRAVGAGGSGGDRLPAHPLTSRIVGHGSPAHA
jgi:hypothetical protein